MLTGCGGVSGGACGICGEAGPAYHTQSRDAIVRRRTTDYSTQTAQRKQASEQRAPLERSPRERVRCACDGGCEGVLTSGECGSEECCCCPC